MCGLTAPASNAKLDCFVLISCIDDRLDLAAVADDPFVFEQTIEVALGEARYPVKIEITEGGAD